MPCAQCGRKSGSESQVCVGCRTLSRIALLWREVSDLDETSGVSALRECAGLLTDLVEVGSVRNSGVKAPDTSREAKAKPEDRDHRERRSSRGRGRRRRRERDTGEEEPPKPKRRTEEEQVIDKRPLEEKAEVRVKEEAAPSDDCYEEEEESEEDFEEEKEPEVDPKASKASSHSLYLKPTGKASASKPRGTGELREEHGKVRSEKELTPRNPAGVGSRDCKEPREGSRHRREPELERRERRSPRREDRRTSGVERPRSPLGPPPRHHGGNRGERSKSRKEKKSKGKRKKERGEEWRRQQGWYQKQWRRK